MESASLPRVRPEGALFMKTIYKVERTSCREGMRGCQDEIPDERMLCAGTSLLSLGCLQVVQFRDLKEGEELIKVWLASVLFCLVSGDTQSSYTLRRQRMRIWRVGIWSCYRHTRKSVLGLFKELIEWINLSVICLSSIYLSSFYQFTVSSVSLYLLYISLSICLFLHHYNSFSGGSEGEESTCNVEGPCLSLGLGRSPGEGSGNPLQYSCLENSMNRGAWQATVHGATESWT